MWGKGHNLQETYPQSTKLPLDTFMKESPAAEIKKRIDIDKSCLGRVSYGTNDQLLTIGCTLLSVCVMIFFWALFINTNVLQTPGRRWKDGDWCWQPQEGSWAGPVQCHVQTVPVWPETTVRGLSVCHNSVEMSVTNHRTIIDIHFSSLFDYGRDRQNISWKMRIG